MWLRGRLVLGLARRLVHSAYKKSRAASRLRRGTANVEIRSSIFCTVREPVPQALCGFYAAACTRLMLLFGVGAQAEVIACRAMGESTCIVRVELILPAPDRGEAS